MSGSGTTRSAEVEVDGLVKAYAERRVVDGVSFRVHAGEVVALLGPNGAGKTTTVETIEGYRRADGGTVRVLGLDPWTGGPALRARVGLMLQGGGGIDPRLTAAEVLRLYARFHRPARPVGELLRLVGLEAVAATRFRRLSGGERQRLALALALVGRPDVLLLDEPTAGLDPAARAETRSLVRSVRDDGAAVLLTTHDLGDVERAADRVVIIDRGRVVADGKPAEVVADGEAAVRLRFDRPLDPADQADLVARLGGTGAPPHQPGHVSARLLTDPGDARSLTLSGPSPAPALVASVAAWAAERGLLIAELRTGGGSLEERYLALTGDRAVERVG